MTEKHGKNGADREYAVGRLITVICYVVAAVAAAGAVGCIVAYALTKLDVLFIPIALCGTVAIIAFTYARVKR